MIKKVKPMKPESKGIVMHLTNAIKRRSMRKEGFMFFSSIRKKFQIVIKTFSGRSSLKVISLKLLPVMGRKVKVVTMTKFFSSSGKFARIRSARIGLGLVGVALALGLVACGGGGGGGTTTPPPSGTPTPTGTLSVAPATCTVQAGLSKCTASTTFAVANATTAKLLDGGGTVLSTSLSGSQIVDVLIGTNSYTLSANGGAVASATATGVCAVGTASNGSICVSPVTATLSATSPVVNGAKSTLTWGYSGDAPTGCTTSANWSNGGGLSGTGQSNALTANTTFTYSCNNANGPTTATAVVTVCAVGDTISGGVCTPPVVTAWWPPATIHLVGEQVIGMNQLSSASLIIGDTAWKQAVTNGTVKFLDTGIVLTGYSTRSIVWAFYKGPLTGNSCTRLIYKDDGTGVANTSTEGNCNTDIPSADWAVGTSVGVIRHFPGKNQCYQLTWNQPTLGLNDLVVTCPF